MNKTIFIGSHFFYPFAGVGAKRCEYFAQYFNRAGFKVVVFKADDRYFDNKLPLGFFFDSIDIISVSPDTNHPTDEQWRLAYLQALNKAISDYAKPEAILFSAGPFFYLPIATEMERKHNINCILDFRDTFFNQVGLYERNGSWTLKKMLYYLQLKIRDPLRNAVRTASAIVTVTDTEAASMIRHYGKSLTTRTHVICNGYDERVLNKIHNQAVTEPSKTLRVGIFGKFAYYDQQSAVDLVAALVAIEKKQPVELLLIGSKEPAFDELLAGTSITLTKTGFVDYLEGMRLLQTCQVCMLNNRSANALGTKVFDYIGLDKPIIAFVQRESELADLLKELKCAYVVTNTKECESALSRIISDGNFKLGEGKDKKKYSREAQAMKLHRLIDGLPRRSNLS